MATLLSLPKNRAALAFRFAVVGLSGVAVNQLALAAFTEFGGVFYLLSAIAATQVSSTWNFVGSEFWVFAGRETRGSRLSRYIAFLALNNSSLILRVPALWLLVSVAHMDYLLANPVTLLLVWAARFLFADGWIWAATSVVKEGASPKPDADGSVPLRLVSSNGAAADLHYDIAGVLKIRSAIRLPELAYFLTDPFEKPDICIEVGRLGSFPTRTTRFVSVGSTLSYYEHLGLVGANFRITMGDPIVVQAAPLLARSPHVLYTNVIEALLRFLLVSRGYVLLHSASMVVNGRATLLSAQTDTGKTSTVIQLIRQHGYGFLSDDMTIIAPDGRAICYPKPMTLSYHTMSSIRGGDLKRGQRAALAVQSRLHSKSGRSVGRFLGTLNLPIMSVNSIVQMLIPPPKYRIDTLIGCEIGSEAPIGHVFLMERGEPLRERIDIDQAVTNLIANTDDAYGFPPFSTFAPHLRIGGKDYAALRRTEEELLRRSLARAVLMRIRVPGHEWADLLPDLMQGTAPALKAVPVDSNLFPIPIVPDTGAILVRQESGEHIR
jgi:dolichol-phosphate mannosyltransferase